jgi:hypothetical protein
MRMDKRGIEAEWMLNCACVKQLAHATYEYVLSSSRSIYSFSINRSMFFLMPAISSVPLFLVALIVSITRSE